MDLERDYPFIKPGAAAKAVEDVNELSVLRSRVEQQAELILLLQRRAEDETNQRKAAQAEVAELRSQCVSADRQRQAAEDERARLMKQFETLSSNHQEIIAFKDEHKRTAEALRQRNATLEAQGKAQEELQWAAVEEATAVLRQEIEALKSKVARLKALLAEAEATRRDLEEQLSRTSKELESVGGARRSDSARAESAKREAARLQADVESYRSQLAVSQEEAREAKNRALAAEAQVDEARRVSEVGGWVDWGRAKVDLAQALRERVSLLTLHALW
jgi:chromosome segregation ATPase